jgi:multidrug efflux pump
MVLGAVPLALSAGAGAESRIQIGWVIVGGMTFGTLLTLYVVPTMYTLMEQALGRWLGSHHHHDDVPVATDAVARHGAE